MHKFIPAINRIATETIQSDYEIGQNDCNLMVLKVIDSLCDTDYISYAKGNYDTVRKGMNIYKKLEVKGLEELVSKYANEVHGPVIYGDIWIDGNNASLVLHNSTIILVNHETNKFITERMAKDMPGKFYRITRNVINGGIK